MATRAEIVAEVYNIMGQPSDSSNYNAETIVIPKINRLVQRLCRGKYRSILNQQSYSAGELDFLKRDFFFTNVTPVSLTTALTTTSTTIEMETANFADSGFVMINSDIIQYTGKTATELTGVTGIDTDHATGQLIFQLFELPEDISKPFTLFRLNKNQRYEPSYFEVPYVDERQMPDKINYFTVVSPDGGETQLLSLRDDYRTTNQYRLIYYLESTDMEAETDVCTIPDPYALEVVAPLVAGEVLWDTQEVEDATTILRRGEAGLTEMFDYMSSLVKKNRPQVRIAPMFYSSGRYGGRR